MGTNQVKSDNGILLVMIALVGLALYNGTPTSATSESFDANDALAYVAGDFAFADSSTPDKPEPPKPAPGKCPVCNGTGKVGDGRIFVECGTCGGTGIIKATAACPCGPDCKCATTPDNPECKCPACKCDPVDVVKLPKWNPVKRKQLRLYRTEGQPLPITDKSLELLKAAGWEIGPNGHIDVREAFPERPHGTWELEDGSATHPTCWIDMTAVQVAKFYETGEAPVPVTVRPKRYVRQCGPNGCRLIEVE